MVKSIITGAYEDGDVDTNTSGNEHLRDLIDRRYSRRATLFGGLSALTVATVGLAACGDDDDAAPTPPGSTTISLTPGGGGTTSAGKNVTLTSSLAGTITQVSGPAVTLTASGSTASFIAPAVAATTPLVFRVAQTGGAATAEATVQVQPARIDFAAVAKNQLDVVSVPAGYTMTVLYRTGDPITAATPAYANNGTDTNFAARSGDHHDGMSYYGLAASPGTAPDPTNSSRGLLVLNHENINQQYLHPTGPTGNPTGSGDMAAGPRPEAQAIKEIECHGVSVIEVVRSGTGWTYVQSSAFNRRITPNTPMTFSGPVAGTAGLRTAYSPTGVAGRGTLNNCANGYMPWGTYLTAEENWAGYFRRPAGDVAARGGASAKANVSLARYGIPEGRAGNYGWGTVTPANAADTTFRRWNIGADAALPADGTGDYRNEANQFGWIVEIDPYTQTSVPRKRTALGRRNHEGAWCGRTVPGVRPAFYMGDDAVGEYVFKFVSAAPWAAADANPADRLATGAKYLDTGTLYVARFNANGSGQWLPLTFGVGPLTAANATYAFADQADVLINSRLAADALGATKMDRPEWTAINPVTGEMYITMTQNTSRTPTTTDAANPRAYTDPKVTTGQANGNANGHIIRIREAGDTTEALTFAWDIYLFGAGSDLSAANINLSGLDASNDFSMCDGLWFSRASNAAGQVSPMLWIQTDDNAYTDVTNCMMLAAMPGTTGDGGARTITNTIGAASATQATVVGKAATPATLRRFLVGCKECEITGVDTTPDGRTMFVNIQHPGENGTAANPSSNWPANQSGPAPGARPRSATIVITKDDGGVVGL